MAHASDKKWPWVCLPTERLPTMATFLCFDGTGITNVGPGVAGGYHGGFFGGGLEGGTRPPLVRSRQESVERAACRVGCDSGRTSKVGR